MQSDVPDSHEEFIIFTIFRLIWEFMVNSSSRSPYCPSLTVIKRREFIGRNIFYLLAMPGAALCVSLLVASGTHDGAHFSGVKTPLSAPKDDLF